MAQHARARVIRIESRATIPRMPARPAPADVDAYIAAHPPAVQAVLRKVRETVRAAAPDAVELISYGIPALKGHGVIVYYAAFRHHVGFYPPVRGDARLEKASARYAGEKGNLRFPLDEPMPYALIGRLTKLRAKQDAAKAARAPRRSRSAAAHKPRRP